MDLPVRAVPVDAVEGAEAVVAGVVVKPVQSLEPAAKDRVGLGWRSEISHSILFHLDQIDLVEVILDDYLAAPTKARSALVTLSKQVPITYHGVTLGLASSIPIDPKRLDKLARLFEYLEPEVWSEHLAFVRAGGVEIGHLTAPPRSLQTIEGSLKNLAEIQRVVGLSPFLENIATLIDPPGSKLSEPNWVSQILVESGSSLLLDLHNLYSNAVNFGFDPMEYLMTFPLDRVGQVHLSGGKWIPEPAGFQSQPGSKRILDDHLHDIPPIVFEMLANLAQSVAQPLTVVIERDGRYPDFEVLLEQLSQARCALELGRSQRVLKGA